MNWFRFRHGVLTVALLCAGVLSLGCKVDTSNPYYNTGPTPTALADTYSGTLDNSGDVPVLRLTHTLTTTNAGTMSITLTNNTPDPALTLGMGIGAWDTTTSTCGQLLAYNNSAVVGSLIIGNAIAGSFCVQVYDVGKLAAGAQTSYTITVTHY